MICPKCNQEMLYGYIPTPGLVWLPRNKKTAIFNQDRKKGFCISKHSYFDYRKQPAYFCKYCEFIVINANSKNLPLSSNEL